MSTNKTEDYQKLAGDILTSPKALAEIQDKSFPDLKQEALRKYLSLSNPTRRRVLALKKLLSESLKIEAEFFKKMNDLEIEFEPLYEKFYLERKDVIVGKTEPVFDESEVPEISGLLEISDVETNEITDVKGIPNFWLTVFNNSDVLSDHKEDFDDDLLSHLEDIQVKINDSSSPRPGWVLNFYFSPNEYFTNSVLKKEYLVRFEPLSTDPLHFDGPEIVESKGCVIQWKTGKNLTVKTVKKTMRHKSRTDKKVVTKTVKTNSFFNFFDPPKGSIENREEEDDDVCRELSADFELGRYLREQIIPRAALFFTGEALEEDEEYESDEEDEENEDSNQKSKGRNRQSSSNSQKDCKQQ